MRRALERKNSWQVADHNMDVDNGKSVFDDVRVRKYLSADDGQKDTA